MSATVVAPVATDTVTKALQQALVDLTDLHLQAKQAHWNIKGEGFRSLHLFLDEIVDGARDAADEVAERLAALGGTPDGRAATVAATSSLDTVEGGDLKVADVYAQFAERTAKVADAIKSTLEAVDAEDHLTNDLLIGIASELEKQAWMLRASLA
ncbi:Dps family protein [Propionibacterium australiense]|uniref:DNA starvation/stationary phase protection protein n=1 Tax=Propionibacterium australiense TaxID=119981 RepID=A0A383S6A2_9ACTN|nr:DNA starvation/stationary phase protection protein [Propionibacterium australiense]RLP10595.1 DNA starvation/stationary phase protection protein [Propionibacterium australiense]RLP12891.1 DNA starvation/stationary phase protection protein [Propionibacterium australiense]SYZ32796.1 Ferritin-related [Propionibacterium australiense]VEH91238.1 DNA protection during starvation protein 2 [Propionibacterium australiense]